MDGACTKSHAEAASSKDLIYWINPEVLIAGLPLKQELYACVAIVAAIYHEWRPDEQEWVAIQRGATDRSHSLSADASRHMARSRPEEVNALYGAIHRYPVHAALIEAGPMANQRAWCRLMALFAWPHIASRAVGAVVEAPATHHVRRFGKLLRDAGAAGELPDHLVDLLWSTWAGLESVAPARSPYFDAPTWAAIHAHVMAYRTTTFEKQVTDHRPFAWGGPFEILVDAERMAEEEAEALAPEDADARRFATQDHSTEDDGSDPLSRVFRNVFEGERAFQHLPLSWDHASPREVTALKNACKDLGAQELIGVALCACLSLPPESLPRLLIHTTFDLAVSASADGNWHLCVTSTGAVVAVHGVQHPEHAYRRKTDSGYRPQAPVTVIGLPWFVSKTLMAQARPAESEMLLRFFPDIAPNTRAAGELLRQATGARLTFGRIQKVVADNMMSATQDECLVARAIPTSSILVGSGIYYSAYPAMKLYRSHGRAVARALNWDVPPAAPELERALRHAYLGSELTIDPTHLRTALDQLYQRAQASIRLGRYSPERIVDAFNCVAAYTLAVICILTGHRPTKEPFPDPADINPATGSAIICDKRQFGSNEQREVPLAKVAEAQFNVYVRTIHAISSYLEREFGDIAANLRSLVATANVGFPSAALFSVLTLDAGKITIRPFERSDWRRMWPEWHWPENGTRHYLMQELNSRGLPRELINYLFGHADPGQTAFNRHSSITPQQFIDSVEPVLSRIAEDLQIKTTGSPKAYGTSNTPAKPLMLEVRLFGDAARAKQRRLTKSEKRFVRDLLSELDHQGVEKPFRVRQHIAHMFNGDMILTSRVLRLLERCTRSSGT